MNKSNFDDLRLKNLFLIRKESTYMIKIVTAQLEDIPIIQSIAAEAWPVAFSDILSEEQITYMMEMMYSTAALEEQITTGNHSFLIAKEADRNIGYLSFELNYKKQPKTKIHKIYLLPDTQGKGVGRLLFDEVSRIALNNTNHTLSLNVNRDNTAVNFYEKIGFEIIGKEDISIGNGFLMEDYIMERQLH